MNPEPFSLRQLFIMARSRMAFAWDHTAALLALSINQHRKKGTQTVKASDLNPFRCKQRQKPIIKLNSKDSMKLLKSVFIDHKVPDLGKLKGGKVE